MGTAEHAGWGGGGGRWLSDWDRRERGYCRAGGSEVTYPLIGLLFLRHLQRYLECHLILPPLTAIFTVVQDHQQQAKGTVTHAC